MVAGKNVFSKRQTQAITISRTRIAPNILESAKAPGRRSN